MTRDLRVPRMNGGMPRSIVWANGERIAADLHRTLELKSIHAAMND
jgi:hypothetical protein